MATTTIEKKMRYVSQDMASAVRRKRGELKLSQVQLAEAMGVSRMTLRKAEAGDTVLYPDIFSKVEHWLMAQI